MFAGSINAESFDDIIQMAGGECNAFTNADITNFYCTLPAINLDTALWLEADRMQFLKINQKSLSTQQQVVTEEFKETCINQPRGMVWHILSQLCYKVHPYRWATTGKKIEHIADAVLKDVQEFYDNFYGPNNAIICVAGPDDPEVVLEKIKDRFGSIPSRPLKRLPRQQEAAQTSANILDDEGSYPSSVIYLAWLMEGRNGEDYYASDLLSDVMSLGRSSLFYQHLVKIKKICAHVDAYITGTEENGLFVIEARPAKDISMEEMEAAIWQELAILQQSPVEDLVLAKLKNKNESTVSFSNVSAAHKATNLAYYESLGDAELINTEAERIAEVTKEHLFSVTQKLSRNNVNILRLKGNGQLIAAPVMEEDEDDED